MKLYHGGKPGLAPGDMILPPSETGVRCSSDYVKFANPHRRDRVYFTSDLSGAALYAAMYPADSGGFGHIYEVIAVEPVEADPDCTTPGLSWEAPRARVVRRIRVKNKLLLKIRQQFMAGVAA